MHRIDNAERMRIRAHQIWEREGRPHGREHEHWAEAARELAAEVANEPRLKPVMADLPRDSETERLRRALYEPADFSTELFGHEAPAVSSRARPLGSRATVFASSRLSPAGAAEPSPS
ncbi:DUF2934 domain-containing protein [Aureimonas glaciei]|uniref:DUF2934 domain-containing protein n=1 Tax=Aureimonas glaciei TaxID=1776957 RepID=A0A916XWW0_9HYPH|nr:DUF2934 domain-containing protein [Aureimonas glaciei]GGD18711.1 hypothetical protein GCM10011335_22020 [Aureimonas glaciei]